MLKKRESPIDINTKNKYQINIDSKFIKFDIFEKGIISSPKLINNNMIFQVKNKLFTEFNGCKFKLEQYHFHNPSEHKIDNIRFPMEVHFVHKFEDQYLVIAFFIKESNNMGPFDLAISIDNSWELNKEIIIEIPNKEIKTFYYYPGSLTTHPHSSNVSWIIFDKPVISNCINKWNKNLGKAKKIQKSCCSEVFKFSLS